MKFIKRFFIPCIISFLICFSIFFISIYCVLMQKNSNSKTVQKTENLIPYYHTEISDMPILVSIKDCPVVFLITLSSKFQNVSVNLISNSYKKDNNLKNITFDIFGFENTINSLGGIEIETPYGLPSPYKNKTLIAKNEKLLAFGASVGQLFTEDTALTTERKEYYCYILEEICIKFFNKCTLESYKLLKQNCTTNISYTEFYDNYKFLKEIKR